VQNCNTGMEQAHTHGISIFPNPTADLLHLTWEGSFHPSEVYILDMQGRTIWKQDGMLPASSVILVEHWPAGTYQVHLYTPHGQYTLPFVKN
jgi:hypothetical protein